MNNFEKLEFALSMTIYAAFIIYTVLHLFRFI